MIDYKRMYEIMLNANQKLEVMHREEELKNQELNNDIEDLVNELEFYRKDNERLQSEVDDLEWKLRNLEHEIAMENIY